MGGGFARSSWRADRGRGCGRCRPPAQPKHLLPLIGDVEPVRADAGALRRPRAVRAADHRRQPGAGRGTDARCLRGRRRAAGARADEARQRAGDRARGAGRRARRTSADVPERPSYRRRRRPSTPRSRPGAPARRGGRHRHLRDRARPSRDRLWLYRRRRAARACGGSSASSRSPTPTARRRCSTPGGHYWNAGIFLARAATWLAAMERHVPDIVARGAAPRSTRRARDGGDDPPRARRNSRARRRSRSTMR